MEATPLGNTVGTEGVTALKAHIVGGFSVVILADSPVESATTSPPGGLRYLFRLLDEHRYAARLAS